MDGVSKSMQQKKSASQEVGYIEDFLASESFFIEDNANLGGVDSAQRNISQHANWMQYQLPSVQQPRPQHQHHNHQNNMILDFTGFRADNVVQQHLPIALNPVLDAGYPEAIVNMPPSSSKSDSQTPGRKRVASEIVVDKTKNAKILNRLCVAWRQAKNKPGFEELKAKLPQLIEENKMLRTGKQLDKLPSVRQLPPPPPQHQHQYHRQNRFPDVMMNMPPPSSLMGTPWSISGGFHSSQYNTSQHVDWMQYQFPSVQPPQQQQKHQNRLNNMMPPGFTGFIADHVVQQPVPNAPKLILDAGYSGELVDKYKEKKKQNRESAKQSRVRKQVESLDGRPPRVFRSVSPSSPKH